MISLKQCVLYSLGMYLLSAAPAESVYNSGGIKVTAVKESDEHSKAELPQARFDKAQPDSPKLIYQIKNYVLKANSKNNLTGICANSKDGQHIHVIIDNKPYAAIYNLTYLIKEDSGSHLALSFLSRSHHQSIKHPKAFKLQQIDLGKPTKKFNLKQPYLFYSRPKGIYTGEDVKNILLDFYLVNTRISPHGNKVRVTIDNKHIFTVDKWCPYLIEGLTMGDHTVKLELIDVRNKLITNPLLPVERKFSIQVNP